MVELHFRPTVKRLVLIFAGVGSANPPTGNLFSLYSFDSQLFALKEDELLASTVLESGGGGLVSDGSATLSSLFPDDDLVSGLETIIEVRILGNCILLALKVDGDVVV